MAATKFRLRIELKGFKELEAKLRALPKRVRNRVTLQALKTGSKPIVKAMKSFAPVADSQQTTQGINIAAAGGKGLLRKSIGIRGKIRRNIGKAYVVMGPRRRMARVLGSNRHGKMVSINPTNISHLMESGHKIIRGGRVVGRFEGTHFVERGFDAGKAEAETIIAAKFEQGIAREAAKG